MISKEELAILQERITQLTEKGEGFAKQIEERKKEKAQLPALRAKVEELTKSNERDEEAQMRELRDVSTELKNIRAELKNPKPNPLEKKIPKLQAQLERLTENAQVIEKSYKEMAEITDKHNEKLKPWTDYIVAASARIDLFKKLLSKSPEASPLFMRVNEAESNLERMKRKVSFLKYHAPKSNLDLADREKLKTSKLEELRNITANIEKANEDIKTGDERHIEALKSLNAVSTILQEITEELKKEKAEIASHKKVYDDKARKAELEGVEHKRRLEAIQKEINSFEDTRRTKLNEAERKKNKAEKRVEELDRKLLDLRAEIQKKWNNAEIIGELTARMEREWLTHQRATADRDASQRRLNRAKEDLRRKRIASEEIEKQWPKAGKAPKGPGMPELERMYEEALKKNRKLGETAASLKDDLVVHQNDNVLLKAYADHYRG